MNLQHGHLSKPNLGIHLSPTNLNIPELDVPMPTTVDGEPSAILTLKFPRLGV